MIMNRCANVRITDVQMKNLLFGDTYSPICTSVICTSVI